MGQTSIGHSSDHFVFPKLEPSKTPGLQMGLEVLPPSFSVTFSYKLYKVGVEDPLLHVIFLELLSIVSFVQKVSSSRGSFIIVGVFLVTIRGSRWECLRLGCCVLQGRQAEP